MSADSRTDIPVFRDEPAGLGRATELLAGAMALPLAAFVSFLPARLRGRFQASLPLTAGAAISAVLQIALVSWWAIAAFQDYARQAQESYTILMGAAHYTGFLLVHPIGILAVYGLLEGLIRLVSATAVGEPLGTLPLWLIDRVLVALGATSNRARLCRDIAIAPPSGGLIVRSCEAKPWDSATTVEYRGAHYQFIERLEIDDPKRPYVHHLDSVSRNHLIRRIHRYSPDEPLNH